MPAPRGGGRGRSSRSLEEEWDEEASTNTTPPPEQVREVEYDVHADDPFYEFGLYELEDFDATRVTLKSLKVRYHLLLKSAHPDKGGTSLQLRRLQAAWAHLNRIAIPSGAPNDILPSHIDDNLVVSARRHHSLYVESQRVLYEVASMGSAKEEKFPGIVLAARAVASTQQANQPSRFVPPSVTETKAMTIRRAAFARTLPVLPKAIPKGTPERERLTEELETQLRLTRVNAKLKRAADAKKADGTPRWTKGQLTLMKRTWTRCARHAHVMLQFERMRHAEQERKDKELIEQVGYEEGMRRIRARHARSTQNNEDADCSKPTPLWKSSHKRSSKAKIYERRREQRQRQRARRREEKANRLVLGDTSEPTSSASGSISKSAKRRMKKNANKSNVMATAKSKDSSMMPPPIHIPDTTHKRNKMKSQAEMEAKYGKRVTVTLISVEPATPKIVPPPPRPKPKVIAPKPKATASTNVARMFQAAGIIPTPKNQRRGVKRAASPEAKIPPAVPAVKGAKVAASASKPIATIAKKAMPNKKPRGSVAPLLTTTPKSESKPPIAMPSPKYPRPSPPKTPPPTIVRIIDEDGTEIRADRVQVVLAMQRQFCHRAYPHPPGHNNCRLPNPNMNVSLRATPYEGNDVLPITPPTTWYRRYTAEWLPGGFHSQASLYPGDIIVDFRRQLGVLHPGDVYAPPPADIRAEAIWNSGLSDDARRRFIVEWLSAEDMRRSTMTTGRYRVWKQRILSDSDSLDAQVLRREMEFRRAFSSLSAAHARLTAHVTILEQEHARLRREVIRRRTRDGNGPEGSGPPDAGVNVNDISADMLTVRIQGFATREAQVNAIVLRIREIISRYSDQMTGATFERLVDEATQLERTLSTRFRTLGNAPFAIFPASPDVPQAKGEMPKPFVAFTGSRQRLAEPKPGDAVRKAPAAEQSAFHGSQHMLRLEDKKDETPVEKDWGPRIPVTIVTPQDPVAPPVQVPPKPAAPTPMFRDVRGELERARAIFANTDRRRAERIQQSDSSSNNAKDGDSK